MASATIAASVAIGIGVAMARSERERRAAHKRIAEPDRTFGLLAHERPAEGLRRIVLGQLDLAIERLRGEAEATPAEAVHETRKAIKRLRATIRLLEGEIGAKRAKRERALLRDAARRLAGARDAEVMVATLDGLLRRQPRKLGRRRGLLELRARLEDERIATAARIQGEQAARAQIVEELGDLRARAAGWRLRDRSAGRLADGGLERIYRAGRAARKHARADKRSPRAMHRWRKHVKDLRYALEALDVEGGSSKRVTKLARRADELGEALGEEHDLMLLAQRARSYEPLKRHPRARKRLLRAIDRRRAQLRAQALRAGGRLYERKPRRFVRDVRSASPA
jgi:CHAD domain-containing protein